MSQPEGNANLFDPLGMMKSMRDASLEQYAKVMTEMVNSEAYAKATGEMLDAWLKNSAPLRDAMQSVLTHTLANLNLPSRDDVTRIAERLTNIEMRLDDMEAALAEKQP
jgi:hypothetical protein